MPSEPRRLPSNGRVLVEHPRFGRKRVTRSQLTSAMAGGWRRVEDKPARRRKKKTSAQSDKEPSAPLSATSSADSPGSEQGDTDALLPDSPGRD
jgi:hypothetical protein